MSTAPFTHTTRFLVEAARAAGIPDEILCRRVRQTFLRLAKQIDPTLTLEVGAFEASFSIWARENLPDARVIAFEANPYVHERFREEVVAAGVDYRNACVGPTNGTVELNVPTDFRGGSRDLVNQMASLNTNLQTENHHVVEVEGVRLDDIAAATDDDRIVAWIDVEGALEMVLSGSEETLRRASVVYVEVENIAMWEGQWLDVDVAQWFGERGLVPVLRDFHRPQQYNLLFVSEELAADPRTARMLAKVYKPVRPKQEPRPQREPMPPAVPTSRRSRLEGVVARGLRAENAQLRALNRRLRDRILSSKG